MNKLEHFILFHLFKFPALLLLIAVVCLLLTPSILAKNKHVSKIITMRQQVQGDMLSTYSHFLDPSSNPEKILRALGIPVTIMSTNPFVLTTDAASVPKIEQTGLLIQAASCTNQQVLVELQPYPPQIN